MKSVQFGQYNAPHTVGLFDAERAPVGVGQVRVDIEVAPLNPSDFMLMDGHYPFRPELPSPAGSEGVGRVTEVGAGVSSVAEGDRVLVLPSDQPGTWQEEKVVDERHVLRVDGNADPMQLATAGINAATAYLLMQYVQLEPGSWVAQTAANSGVGMFVLALARRAGLRTLNVVRRTSAVAALRDAGADVVLVGDEDLPARLSEALGDDEIGLLIDGVGGPIIDGFVPHLARGAHIVSYAVPTGLPIIVNPMHLNFHGLHVHGFWVHNWLDSAPRAEIERVYAHLTELIADGTLRTPIDAVYHLDDYSTAIAHARSSRRAGKILFGADTVRGFSSLTAGLA
ncbi:MAG: trans-2-enoyl-CoA reductase [Mycobacterium sp.]|nr:trans-2-enoyl-CoA reductase [Mycobacterium sp.]